MERFILEVLKHMSMNLSRNPIRENSKTLPTPKFMPLMDQNLARRLVQGLKENFQRNIEYDAKKKHSRINLL